MKDLSLTQQKKVVVNKYEENWQVCMSTQEKPFILNEKEYADFERALLSGKKGIIKFNRFTLNTSFFVSSELLYRVERPPKNL